MICVPILAKDNDEAIEKMARALDLADLLELRLDSFQCFDLRYLIPRAPCQLIVTYRSRKEGGMGNAHYSTRMQYLKEAISLGAQYIDLEYTIPLEHRSELLANRGSSKIIISKHIRHGTPSNRSLRQWLQRLIATGADVVKLVTMATEPQDNIRVLQLIPVAARLGVRIITFCMGDKGKISRVASVPMGAFLTFASLDARDLSAPGQIPARHMKTILELLRS